MELRADGWGKNKVLQEPVTLKTQVSLSGYEYSNEEMETIIKKELAENIAKELVQKDLVEYRLTNRPEDFSYTFQGSVKVMPQDTVKAFHNENVFIVNGIQFNTKQIKEALMNYYPEYYI